MICPTDFYVIRIPTLPFNNIKLLNNAIRKNDVQEIKKFLMNPLFMNAIYLSSRDFYYKAKNWMEKEVSDFDYSDSVLQSMYKYYIRMCSRSTPYGLFAGVAMGKTTMDKTKIKIATDNLQPFVRVDNLFINKIKEEIIRKNKTNNLPFYPNNTLYSIGNYWRYISWDHNFNYEILEIKKNIILEQVLSIAYHGITKVDIKLFLINNSNCHSKSISEIERYIEVLIDAKFLVDRMPPYMTSLTNPLLEVEQYLIQYNFDTKLLIPIINLEKRINYEFFNSFDCIDEIERVRKKINSIIDINDQFFQVDTRINLNLNQVNKNVVELLSQRMKEIMLLRGKNINPDLVSFIERFYNKFDTKEVPLMLALDPDYGVGYSTFIRSNLEELPLLQDVYFPLQDTVVYESSVSPLIDMIIKEYIECFSTTIIQPIILTDERIGKLKTEELPSILFGVNCHLFGSFICKTQEDIDNGNFKFMPLSNVPTSNVSDILSRYAYYDEELLDSLKEIIEVDSENCIHAELLYHKKNRLANVLMRPNLYDYTVAYLADCSENELHNTISLNDIYIRYEGGRIKLIAKKLNKEIKIRYSNAYNFDNSQLSVIKFLGDYQYYNLDHGFKWNWGYLKNNDFLPRVEYKEIILSVARWKIHKDQNIDKEILKQILRERNIPTFCTIRQRDNVLVLDLSLDICLDLLIKKIVIQSLWLYEYLDSAKFFNEEGDQFVAEFIFPFKCEEQLPQVLEKVKVCDNTEQRQFLPGDEWSFFKIYTSPYYGDTVIKEVIKKYVKQLPDSICWFFIRYNDPDFHIRFRIKRKITKQNVTILNDLLNDLIKNGIVSYFQIDTYNREIERYGIETINLSEIYFMYDSIAILKLLSKKRMFNNELRWKVAVVSIHFIMNDFNISLLNRIQIFEDMYKSLMLEIIKQSNTASSTKQIKVSLDKKFRSNKDFLDSTLRLNNLNLIVEFVKPLKERSKNTSELVSAIKNNVMENQEYITLIKDYVHLNMNRIFVLQARKQEMVLYYLLFKTYNSIYFRKIKQ